MKTSISFEDWLVKDGERLLPLMRAGDGTGMMRLAWEAALTFAELAKAPEIGKPVCLRCGGPLMWYLTARPSQAGCDKCGVRFEFREVVPHSV